jgi:hypothetical protein
MTNKNPKIFFRFDDFPKESRKWFTFNWKQFFSEKDFKVSIMETNLLLNSL